MPNRIAVVVTCVDAQNYADEAFKWLLLNSKHSDLILLDNGSEIPLTAPQGVRIVRFEENVGGNASITAMLPHTMGYEVVAFIHCDMFVREFGWDTRILALFDSRPNLALAGFVGSPQCDELGGRGSGTRLNYLGEFYEGFGQCTTAEQHGIRDPYSLPVANLDHCALIFRRTRLAELTDVPFCPTHFYDRALCAECNYRGWEVAYIGISCDHCSGGTAGGAASQERIIKTWLEQENIPYDPVNPSMAAYKESERRFWERYRDTLKMVPYFIEEDGSHLYWSHNGREWVSRKKKCKDCKWNWACNKHGGGILV